MKTKPTIKPKRKAKSGAYTFSKDGREISADEAKEEYIEMQAEINTGRHDDLLNTLSKNTQDVEQKEKVYCNRCNHFLPNTWSWDSKSHCQHKSCFEKRETPIEVIDFRIDDYNNKNAANNCADYKKSEPLSTPPPPVAPQSFPSVKPKPSLWQRIFSWNK